MNKMMKNLAAQLVPIAFGASLLLGDAPLLSVSDQEMTVRVTIPVEEDLSGIEDDWTSIPGFLGSLRSVGDAELESLRAILNAGLSVEIDLRYQEEGIPYSLRFWIKDGEIARGFVRQMVVAQALGPDLVEVQDRIEEIMEERFREIRKQSDEAVGELQRRAAAQRKMLDEIERRNRRVPDRPRN